MNRNKIYIILSIITLLTFFASYQLINTEIKTTQLTVANTKAQPCPDYWTYDSEKNVCYDLSGEEVDFSNKTFCEKQQYSKNIDDPKNNIPWNGISNVYNPRCDTVSVSHTDNISEQYDDNSHYFLIHYVYFYSILILFIVVLEFVFNEKGNRGRIFIIFFLCVFIEILLFYILGIDIQSMFFGKRYTNRPNLKDDNRKKCYDWSCIFD